MSPGIFTLTSVTLPTRKPWWPALLLQCPSSHLCSWWWSSWWVDGPSVTFLLHVKLTPIKTVSSPSPTKVWSMQHVLQLTIMEYHGAVPVLIIEVNMSMVDGVTVKKLVKQVNSTLSLYSLSFWFISGCKTISGPDPGKLCVFPFKWDGVVYRECTTHTNNGLLWCATHVDHLGNTTQWGNCDMATCPGCRTTAGTTCQLPFIYNNVTHNECVEDSDTNKLWCLSAPTDGEGDRTVVRAECQPGCASKEKTIVQNIKLNI